MITDEFIQEIPNEINNGVQYILTSYFTFNAQNYSTPESKSHVGYIEYYYLTEAYLKSHNFEFKTVVTDVSVSVNIQRIRHFFESLKIEFDKRITSDFVSSTKEKFHHRFNNIFSYEFTDGDVGRIQDLLNELRKIISDSDLYTAEHKQRILTRLEKLQLELHKKVSDLDRFWGLIGDAGVAIGKFGKDAKPIVDRIKEISEIVWRTQAKKEELPSGSTIPFLKSAEDNNN